MTSSELSRYRRELERALNDRTIGNAPVAGSLRAKLEEVINEDNGREQIRNAGRAWPVHN
jgi:hypothetical protein